MGDSLDKGENLQSATEVVNMLDKKGVYVDPVKIRDALEVLKITGSSAAQLEVCAENNNSAKIVENFINKTGVKLANINTAIDSIPGVSKYVTMKDNAFVATDFVSNAVTTKDSVAEYSFSSVKNFLKIDASSKKVVSGPGAEAFMESISNVKAGSDSILETNENGVELNTAGNKAISDAKAASDVKNLKIAGIDDIAKVNGDKAELSTNGKKLDASLNAVLKIGTVEAFKFDTVKIEFVKTADAIKAENTLTTVGDVKVGTTQVLETNAATGALQFNAAGTNLNTGISHFKPSAGYKYFQDSTKKTGAFVPSYEQLQAKVLADYVNSATNFTTLSTIKKAAGVAKTDIFGYCATQKAGDTDHDNCKVLCKTTAELGVADYYDQATTISGWTACS